MKEAKYTKTALAQQMGVSRSSLYHRSKQDEKDAALREQIVTTLSEHHAYGHRRIALHLGRNKKAVLRVMKKYGIQPYRRAKKPRKEADQGRAPQMISNILKRLCPIRPYVVWGSDFTYIAYQGIFIFLSTMIDAWTREIVGFHIATQHTADLILNALKHALTRHPAPQYAHSDQGSEYCSEAYKNFTKQHGIELSMSAKGKPWENGYQESFYSTFKREFGDPSRFQSLELLIEAVCLQIHYYNSARIHTSIKSQPTVFRQQILSTARSESLSNVWGT